jgi:hypothetical protein
MQTYHRPEISLEDWAAAALFQVVPELAAFLVKSAATTTLLEIVMASGRSRRRSRSG